MAEINKLSVEKTLNKLRANDAKQSKEAMLNDKSNVLDEEIGRMRAQRLRLERHQGKHHQERHSAPKTEQQRPLPRRDTGGWHRAYSGFCAHKPVALREHEPEIAPVGNSLLYSRLVRFSTASISCRISRASGRGRSPTSSPSGRYGKSTFPANMLHPGRDMEDMPMPQRNSSQTGATTPSTAAFSIQTSGR